MARLRYLTRYRETTAPGRTIVEVERHQRSRKDRPRRRSELFIQQRECRCSRNDAGIMMCGDTFVDTSEMSKSRVASVDETFS